MKGLIYQRNKNHKILLPLLITLFINTLGNGALFCDADSEIDGIARSPWTHTSGAITETEWTKMVAILREDPEIDELLSSAKERLGLDSIQELKGIISICSNLEGGTAGSYRNKEGTLGVIKTYETEGSPEKVAFGARGAELLSSSLSSKLVSTPVRYVLKTEQNPEICMRPGLSNLDAYTVIVHELTHLIRDIPFDEEDILSYSGPEEFIRRELETPWGELEAYTAQARALIRLKDRSKSVTAGHQGELLRYFNSKGELNDRTGLIDYILSDLGYNKNLRDKYFGYLRSQHHSSGTELTLYRETYRPRTVELIDKLSNHVQQIQNWKLSISAGATQDLHAAEKKLAAARAALDFQTNQLKQIDLEITRLNARASKIRQRAASLGLTIE